MEIAQAGLPIQPGAVIPPCRSPCQLSHGSLSCFRIGSGSMFGEHSLTLPIKARGRSGGTGGSAYSFNMNPFSTLKPNGLHLSLPDSYSPYQFCSHSQCHLSWGFIGLLVKRRQTCQRCQNGQTQL